jgi:hypothetical protein
MGVVDVVIAVVVLVSFAAAADRTSSQLKVQSPPSPSGGTELHYAIREELPIGSPLADIVADAGLHVHGVDAVRSFRFRLINQQQQPAVPSSVGGVIGSSVGGGGAVVGGGVFVVGETTGVVRVGARLDRETICSAQSSTSAVVAVEQTSRCVIRLDIAVQPMAYFQIIKVSMRPHCVHTLVGVSLQRCLLWVSGIDAERTPTSVVRHFPSLCNHASDQ